MRTKVKKNGFTMIEIIVSMALLAVITVPLMMLFSGALGLLVDSSKTIELNSISRKIKVDVYNAYRGEDKYRRGLWDTTSPSAFEYTFDPENFNRGDFDPRKDVKQLPSAVEQREDSFGIWVYDENTIHPEYKYNVIMIDDITIPDGYATGEDFYDANQALGSAYEGDGEIVRVFFMNIPLKADDFWLMEPITTGAVSATTESPMYTEVFTTSSAINFLPEIKCMIEVVKIDLD